MGTNHSVPCNEVTNEIWSFCVDRGIWLSAAYVPGKDNVEADEESRRINFDTEWQIRSDLLRHALSILEFEPKIDLFASRPNHSVQFMWLIRLTQKLWLLLYSVLV